MAQELLLGRHGGQKGLCITPAWIFMFFLTRETANGWAGLPCVLFWLGAYKHWKQWPRFLKSTFTCTPGFLALLDPMKPHQALAKPQPRDLRGLGARSGPLPAPPQRPLAAGAPPRRPGPRRRQELPRLCVLRFFLFVCFKFGMCVLLILSCIKSPQINVLAL